MSFSLSLFDLVRWTRSCSSCVIVIVIVNVIVRSQKVDTFMFEGHDTTATNMSFTLWLLATHPQIQRRLEEKILLGLTMWSHNLMMI